jgi:plasmid stability protein
MSSLTVRNIPDSILEKIRILSEVERRSINSEILFILENGLSNVQKAKRRILDKQIQITIWKEIKGQWIDSRSTNEIISDIYQNRSLSREFNL